MLSRSNLKSDTICGKRKRCKDEQYNFLKLQPPRKRRRIGISNAEIDEILSKKRVFLHVMGPHAGESIEQIFEKKKDDIQNVGYCFWAISRSSKYILSFCNKIKEKSQDAEIYCIMLRSKGAKDTKIAESAEEYLIPGRGDRMKIPQNMNPVTGKLPKSGLVFDEILEVAEKENNIDLFYFHPFQKREENYVRFNTGARTIFGAVRATEVKPKIDIPGVWWKEENQGKYPKRNLRSVCAICRLSSPYCVKLLKPEKKEISRKKNKKKNHFKFIDIIL